MQHKKLLALADLSTSLSRRERTGSRVVLVALVVVCACSLQRLDWVYLVKRCLGWFKVSKDAHLSCHSVVGREQEPLSFPDTHTRALFSL